MTISFPIMDRATKKAGDKYAFVIAGPYGTGKSTLLGSMAKYGKTLCIAMLAREANSWLYRSLSVPTILLEDRGWQPENNRYDATAYARFMKLMEELLADTEYDNIAIDSGTELAEAAWHASLAAQGKISSPAEMTDSKSRWLPYESLDNKLDQAVKAMTALCSADCAKRPKHIGISWHTQPPKDDVVAAGDTKKSADHKGEGVEYEGSVLPMVRGKFRRRLGGLVDAFLFSDISIKPQMGGLSVANRGMDIHYRVQVRPDLDRHTKLPGPLPETSYIENDFGKLVKLIEQSYQATAAAADPAPAPAAGSLRRK